VSPVRVFHCDDSSAFRVLVREMLLEFGGVTVVGEAGSLEEALVRLPGAKPDVVLVDLFEGLPGEDALEPLREAAPDAQFLLYTGMPADRVGGSERHVHKSVAFEELHRIITEAAARA
jgi:two-component system response regulator DevR